MLRTERCCAPFFPYRNVFKLLHCFSTFWRKVVVMSMVRPSGSVTRAGVVSDTAASKGVLRRGLLPCPRRRPSHVFEACELCGSPGCEHTRDDGTGSRVFPRWWSKQYSRCRSDEADELRTQLNGHDETPVFGVFVCEWFVSGFRRWGGRSRRIGVLLWGWCRRR